MITRYEQTTTQYEQTARDTRPHLARGVLFAEQFLDGDGLEDGAVARGDAHQLDEELDGVRVVVPPDKARFQTERSGIKWSSLVSTDHVEWCQTELCTIN